MVFSIWLVSWRGLFQTKPLMTLLYRNGGDYVAICFVFTSIFFLTENLLHN